MKSLEDLFNEVVGKDYIPTLETIDLNKDFDRIIKFLDDPETIKILQFIKRNK